MVFAENAYVFVLKFDEVLFVHHRLSDKYEAKITYSNQFVSGDMRVRLFPLTLVHALTDDGCGAGYPTLKTHDHQNSFAFETVEKYEAACEFLRIEPCADVLSSKIVNREVR